MGMKPHLWSDTPHRRVRSTNTLPLYPPRSDWSRPKYHLLSSCWPWAPICSTAVDWCILQSKPNQLCLTGHALVRSTNRAGLAGVKQTQISAATDLDHQFTCCQSQILTLQMHIRWRKSTLTTWQLYLGEGDCTALTPPTPSDIIQFHHHSSCAIHRSKLDCVVLLDFSCMAWSALEGGQNHLILVGVGSRCALFRCDVRPKRCKRRLLCAAVHTHTL